MFPSVYLTNRLFGSVLFTFLVCGELSSSLLLLASNLSELCLENIFFMISNLSSLLMLVLWPSIWLTLETVSCMYKRMYLLLLCGMSVTITELSKWIYPDFLPR